MFPTENFPYLISILANFLLATFVLSRGRNDKINRSFFAMVIAANGWLISLFFYYNLDLPQYISLIGRINFALVLPVLYTAFRFSIIFPRTVISVSDTKDNLIKIWLLILIIVSAFTPFISKEEIITGPGQRETVYGALYPVYIITYLLFASLAIALLFYKTRKVNKKVEKIQVVYVLLGLTLGLVFGFVTNIVLPFFGFFNAANYGPLATLVFVIFVTAAIIRHHLFETKVILVEFLVAVITIILLGQALVTETIGSRILNWGIFALFCFFGYFLIKSTLGEIEKRKEIEKISEDLANAYRELKRLDKAKTEFISIASHQLRTPLTAIKGYLSLIQEGTYGKFSPKMKRPLENVYISAERLIKLVNDLLNISRLEAGKIKLKIEKLSLEDIIDSVVEELKNLAEKKKLTIVWKRPEEPLPQILADRENIRQVVLNLIDNAIRYTQEGTVKVECSADKNVYRMKVKDTGEGMNKEELSKLFKRFSRGSGGQRTWTEGTGLGLYIAKKFVDMYKGNLWAESRGKGKGSAFYLELPIHH